jgi:hypothetical protein
MASAAILELREEIKLFYEMVSTWSEQLKLGRGALKGGRPGFASSIDALAIVKKARLYTTFIKPIWLCLSSSRLEECTSRLPRDSSG